MGDILTLAHDAADELGLIRPATLFAAYDEGDTSDRKLLRALHKTCAVLAAGHDWQVIQARHSWSAVAAVDQPGGLPGDFLRVVDETFWNESRRLPVVWPMTSRDWQEAEAGISPITSPSAIQDGNVIKIRPAPSVNEVFAFRYIRKRIGFAADGTTARERFSADTDTPLWDDELVTLGVVYHFRKMERLDYAQDERDFDLMKIDRIKADGGIRTYNMGGGSSGDAASRLHALKSAAIIVGVPSP